MQVRRDEPIDHDVEEATRLLLEGKYSRAVQILRAQSEAEPSDRVLRAALACALVYDGSADEAETVMRGVPDEYTSPEASAWIAGARALIASKAGDIHDARSHLDDAREFNPENPLVNLMLGRLSMLVDNDLEQAEGLFRWLLAWFPDSETAALHLASVLCESDRRSEGRQVALRNARAHPTSLKSLLLTFSALIVGSPLRGGLFVASMVVLTFFPYLGPLIVVTWAAVALASNVVLRRIWPRMAVFPIVGLVAITLGYAARSIAWGRFYP